MSRIAKAARSPWLAGCILAAALLSATGWWGFRQWSAHRIAASAVPKPPAFGDLPAELGVLVARAEGRASGWLRPAQGLGDLARLYHANGFYDEALSCYEGLQRLEPAEGRWWHLPAIILAGFGRFDDALPLWTKAQLLAPEYLPCRIKLADSLVKANRLDEAAKAYEVVLARQAGNPYALLGLARCRVARQDWTRAREVLQDAIGKHPEFIGGLSLLVTVEMQLGHQAEAARLRAVIGRREFTDIPDPWFEETFASCFDAYRLSVAAAVAYFSGNTTQAVSWLERAIELAPGLGTYRRQLGNILFQKGDFPAARRQFERAVELNPLDTEAWSLLVELLDTMQDGVGVDRALAAGLANCPRSSTLHFRRGQRLAASGRNQEAMAELQEAKRLRPNEANAYIGLAMVYFRMERIEDAVAELRQALEVQPGHTLAMQVLARHAVASGDSAAARHWIRQLRDQAKSDSTDLSAIAEEYRQQFGQVPY